MSRTIEVDVEHRLVRETIVSMDECRHLCNDVCTNNMSGNCGAFVPAGGCDKKRCIHFEKEDGIIEN